MLQTEIKIFLSVKQCYIYYGQNVTTMIYNRIFFFLLCVSLYTSSFGQDMHQQMLDSFSGKFMTAIRTHEKQRVYMVTDKSFFTNGESIWFKAFLLNDISHGISTKSRFLFVDLVNEKDSVIKQVILDAENKQTNSRIVLPDFIASGYYWLRAYTRQMAKRDVNSICVKPIYIVGRIDDNFSDPLKKSINVDSIPTVTFYPEGGSVITGVNSTVALRISQLNGKPLGIDGLVKDSHDTIVARFTTNTNGLGKFDFEPNGYRKYRAIFNWHGKEISYPLPSFNFYSGQISVTKQSAGYNLRILLGDSIYRKDFLTYVIGVSKDSLIFAGIGKGLYEVPVAEKNLPDGITTFYLFDEGFNLLSERSIYVHDNNVHIRMATDKEIYARREKVSLNLSITDAGQHPIPSLVTISVTNTIFSDPGEQCPFTDTDYRKDAIDNLYLGRIECLTDDETDLMMLVRDNNYQTLSRIIHRPNTYDTDSLLFIKGIVLNKKNKPSGNEILTLLSNSGDLIMHTDTTDNAGHFCFPLENYSDSTQFALEVRNLKGNIENNNIVLDTFVYPKLNTPVSLKQYLPIHAKDIKKYLNTYYDAELINEDKHLLPRVIVKEGKKVVNYDESKRVSSNSAILASDDLNERNSVGNAVLKVGGLHILNGYLVINGLTAMRAPDATSEPMLLVNGVEVAKSTDLGETSPDMSYLNSLNPKNIDFIEILKGPEGANYGIRGGNGVILVNLLNTQRDLNSGRSNVKTFYAKGISNPVPFPNKDYQLKDIKTTTSSDTRTTLYWNGDYLTNDVHNSTLTFYTSDIPATYKATITGITIHGDIIYKTIIFQSK